MPKETDKNQPGSPSSNEEAKNPEHNKGSSIDPARRRASMRVKTADVAQKLAEEEAKEKAKAEEAAKKAAKEAQAKAEIRKKIIAERFTEKALKEYEERDKKFDTMYSGLPEKHKPAQGTFYTRYKDLYRPLYLPNFDSALGVDKSNIDIHLQQVLSFITVYTADKNFIPAQLTALRAAITVLQEENKEKRKELFAQKFEKNPGMVVDSVRRTISDALESYKKILQAELEQNFSAEKRKELEKLTKLSNDEKAEKLQKINADIKLQQEKIDNGGRGDTHLIKTDIARLTMEAALLGANNKDDFKNIAENANIAAYYSAEYRTYQESSSFNDKLQKKKKELEESSRSVQLKELQKKLVDVADDNARKQAIEETEKRIASLEEQNKESLKLAEFYTELSMRLADYNGVMKCLGAIDKALQPEVPPVEKTKEPTATSSPALGESTRKPPRARDASRVSKAGKRLLEEALKEQGINRTERKPVRHVPTSNKAREEASSGSQKRLEKTGNPVNKKSRDGNSSSSDSSKPDSQKLSRPGETSNKKNRPFPKPPAPPAAGDKLRRPPSAANRAQDDSAVKRERPNTKTHRRQHSDGATADKQQLELSQKAAAALAAKEQKAEAFKALLKHKADNGQEVTREQVLALLTPGTDINFAKNGEQTPLQMAVSHGHAEAMKVLLEKGANPDLPVPGEKSTRRTALHFAVISNCPSDMFRALLEKVQNPNQYDEVKNQTPLGYAVSKAYVEKVQLLVEHSRTSSGAKENAAKLATESVKYYNRKLDAAKTDEERKKTQENLNKALYIAALLDPKLAQGKDASKVFGAAALKQKPVVTSVYESEETTLKIEPVKPAEPASNAELEKLYVERTQLAAELAKSRERMTEIEAQLEKVVKKPEPAPQPAVAVPEKTEAKETPPAKFPLAKSDTETELAKKEEVAHTADAPAANAAPKLAEPATPVKGADDVLQAPLTDSRTKIIQEGINDLDDLLNDLTGEKEAPKAADERPKTELPVVIVTPPTPAETASAPTAPVVLQPQPAPSPSAGAVADSSSVDPIDDLDDLEAELNEEKSARNTPRDDKSSTATTRRQWAKLDPNLLDTIDNLVGDKQAPTASKNNVPPLDMNKVNATPSAPQPSSRTAVEKLEQERNAATALYPQLFNANGTPKNLQAAQLQQIAFEEMLRDAGLKPDSASKSVGYRDVIFGDKRAVPAGNSYKDNLELRAVKALARDEVKNGIQAQLQSEFDRYNAALRAVQVNEIDRKPAGGDKPNEYVGLGLNLVVRNGHLTVQSVAKGTDAEARGLQQGHVITAIQREGKDKVELNGDAKEALKILKDATLGSAVNVWVLGSDKPVELHRNLINIKEGRVHNYAEAGKNLPKANLSALDTGPAKA